MLLSFRVETDFHVGGIFGTVVNEKAPRLTEGLFAFVEVIMTYKILRAPM